jgi:uncharacterized membrane protein HdeD (DUF308 family)
MTLSAACGILAAARLGRGPRRYSFLCGLAFGVAASFSPKMAPLCLLVPILCVLECRRLGRFRPVGLVVPNALGFLLGIAPLAAWLFAHRLFEPFRQASLINGHVFNLLLSYLLPAIAAGKLITALAIAGGLLLVEMQRERPAGPWPPGNALLAAALLAWLVPILEPNHLAYNLQMFAMPAAVLGTVLMVKLAEPGGWPRRLQLGLLTVALAYISAGPALQGIATARAMAGAIPMADLQNLIALCKSADLTCVALTPYHPIYCRDASDAYLFCDYAFATSSWIPKAAQRPYRAMWPRAVAAIESQPPSFLVTPEIWTNAFHDGLLDQEQYRRLQQVVQARYQPVLLGRTSVLVRTDLLRPGR